ncbi:MAG: hypothetical protein FWG87_10520 [Defluviitaleaceae bacterium]|nr:hypothetical protein [Defluviitaleaceae bacterium]
MKDENAANEAKAITEEQLGEVSGGYGGYELPPLNPSNPSGGSGGGVKPDPVCTFQRAADHVKATWPEQIFIEDGVEVRRTKCGNTNFCFGCRCKGTWICKDTWHHTQSCLFG